MDLVLSSGAKLNVTQAPYVDAMALHKSLLASVKGLAISDDIMKTDINVLKDALIAAATSDVVESALFKCAERATYNNIRVTKDIFDDPKVGTQAREDFYEIAWRIVEVNCGPFIKRAFLKLKTFPGKGTSVSPA